MDTWYRRRSKWGGEYTVCRTQRDKKYNKKKIDFNVKANDKLKMLGILYLAGFRAADNKGLRYKEIKIFLSDYPERKHWADEKKIEREYSNIVIYKGSVDIRYHKVREMEAKKSQIVRV